MAILDTKSSEGPPFSLFFLFEASRSRKMVLYPPSALALEWLGRALGLLQLTFARKAPTHPISFPPIQPQIRLLAFTFHGEKKKVTHQTSRQPIDVLLSSFRCVKGFPSRGLGTIVVRGSGRDECYC